MCENRARVEAMSHDLKDEIRAVFANSGKIAAMRLLRERLDMGLYDARDIVHELCEGG
ncbi:hypothetical protein FRUB_10625 [Fimbriiglobus ruber]|uniref:FtsK gamma domain-containing protein n=1 Tax=Fimbriiglobus ruber TaxID=1908690 RepID=A0A225D4T8_9BACT|nr:hypothetical protein FRUB_10625 [Fimbriiglobus ruber]